ncbi:hypothetical protein SAMN04487949_0447 [Halogranum gelatinilyticum]|uniref:Uncharacterized protein n=1 Tax=Halogranum gelatinilyticum TaxID=660521 RepID=A0A1G9PMJ7_9EURY|nr:hypothetical protein [Halogranum gelatinilyticum]SDL99934.1 hypothetical protein SAMN04487949_0447 [Halogranum gelatinilyticum]
MSSDTHYRPLRYPLGVVGLVAVGFLLRAALRPIFERVTAGSATWLPMFGTVAQTVVVYSRVVTLFAAVLVPVAAFWLGMQYGQHSG